MSLSQMMHLAMLGGPGGASTDADAAAWEAAVIANSGTVSAGTLAAVSAFCAAAKAHSYWTKLGRINLFAGNQLAAALVPLKAGGGNATDTNMNFVSGDYTEATGLTGNSSSKYLKTGLLANSFTSGNTHLSVYNRAGSATGGGCHIGAFGAEAWQFFAPHGSAGYLSDHYIPGVRVQVAATGPFGHILTSRPAAATHVLYRNGSSIGSNTAASTINSAVEFYVFARNNNGVTDTYSGQPLGAYSIGLGMSGTDAANYYTDLQALMTALGRNV